MKTTEEFENRNLAMIKATGRQDTFGTIFVQQICQIGYNQARRTIERGIERGILVRDEYCDWQCRLSPALLIEDVEEPSALRPEIV